MKSKHQESIEFYIKVFKLALPIALQSLITIGVILQLDVLDLVYRVGLQRLAALIDRK